MNTTETPAKLLFADSEKCADMLYLGKMFVPDAFLALDCGARKFAILHNLEIARARKVSAFNQIVTLNSALAEVKKITKKDKPSMADMIRWLLGYAGVETVTIPHNFPAAIAFELRQMRVPFTIAEKELYPEREIKTPAECLEIKKGNIASAAGIQAAERILRASTIVDGYIHYNGATLTSEILRTQVEIACLEQGAMPAHTIVAGGDQACDPHCAGSGPLHANELIIVDVFPRLSSSGYYGDMTRTFLKGHASSAQIDIVNTVKEGQKKALETIRAGVEAKDVHVSVENYFNAKNFKTETINGVPCGFFHGTGHGLGLEVHEAPRLNVNGPTLKSGMVVTVEPGLYYPGLGGCRIEDVVCVTEDGYELLSNSNYTWQIP